jgi:DnaJ-class molecular chaperone
MSHAHLKRDGNDLHYNAEISLSEALNGGTVKVKHFNDKTPDFTFGPLTNTDEKKRIRGWGMPISKTPGTFGDLLIKFEIALPKGKRLIYFFNFK